MSMPRLQLKQTTGWFAAGREVAEALMLLSESAFRLYIYICLNADRHTGRLAIDPAGLAHVLRREPAAIGDDLGELARHDVCHRRMGALEICDRFWPYHRQPLAALASGQADYIRLAREAFLEPACVCSAFTPADQKLAAELHRRGVPLENLRRAIWLGSARKYIAMLNGQPPAPIASLGYFAGLLEEVTRAPVADAYWQHVRQKLLILEQRWGHTSRPAVAPEA